MKPNDRPFVVMEWAWEFEGRYGTVFGARSSANEIVLRVAPDDSGPVAEFVVDVKMVVAPNHKIPRSDVWERGLHFAFGSPNEKCGGMRFPLGRTLARVELLTGEKLARELLAAMSVGDSDGWRDDYRQEVRRQIRARHEGREPMIELRDGYLGDLVPEGLCDWLALSDWWMAFSRPLSIAGIQESLASAAEALSQRLARRFRSGGGRHRARAVMRRVGVHVDRLARAGLERAERIQKESVLPRLEVLALEMCVAERPEAVTRDIMDGFLKKYPRRSENQPSGGSDTKRRRTGSGSAHVAAALLKQLWEGSPPPEYLDQSAT